MSAYEIQARISVPSSLPITTRLSAPALKILKTLSGNFWSRHKVSAVASITFKFLVMASSKDKFR